jgi:hypothetical protein
VVLLVDLEVLGEVFDFFREDCDLNFARSGVTIVTLKLFTDGGFVNLSHDTLFFLLSVTFR